MPTPWPFDSEGEAFQALKTLYKAGIYPWVLTHSDRLCHAALSRTMQHSVYGASLSQSRPSTHKAMRIT
jgi:hypothetical protein